MAVLLAKPVMKPQARVVSAIKFRNSYVGLHTPPVGQKLTPESVTEGSVLGFDDRRDAMHMAARLVAHRRASQSWPVRVVDPEIGFMMCSGSIEAGVLDTGELQIVEEPFQSFKEHLALNGIALRTISRVCTESQGSLNSTVHVQHVSEQDRKQHLERLLVKMCPEHF